jgi:hypothetical protein
MFNAVSISKRSSLTVFYSWQANLPNSTNRSFIQTALQKAIESLYDNRATTVEPSIDRDTAGVMGSPDIVNTILEKIEKCNAFVCDVSIINPDSEKYQTPNPNVLFELGYAVKTLGWEKVIMIFNEAYGSVEALPFDLRGRRILKYCVKKEEQEKSPKRKILEKQLASQLKGLIKHRHMMAFESQ